MTRGHLGLLAGCLLASACGGSKSGTSGGTTAGTTGGTGGNATGGTSSGGTTGGLGAGTACSGNAQCASGVCGVDGSGRCCTAACATSDVACGASGCDATGTCIYPSSAEPCATDFCTGHTITRSACNGAGGCEAGPPTPCANSLQCSDASHCFTQCTASGDCVTGFYCDSATHACLAQKAHGACTTNDACTSGVCGVAGSGNCCTAACTPSADPRCDPNTCDATSGACLMPATCGTPSCTGNTLTAGTCTAAGTCNVGTRTCPNNLLCDSAGTGCQVTCTGSADCLSGFYCSGTGCLPQVGAGFFCSVDQACTSGICGVGGFGHCCLTACDTSHPICGAKDCDSSGYCSFPGTETSCGAAESCSGTTETAATTCNYGGNCPAPPVTDCTPYVCGATACLTTCSDGSSCATGSFCDTGATSCCTLGSGGTINVDGTTGKDTTACCGIGTTGACQTLTHAMALIDAAQAQNVTINATVNGGGGDWTATETYPVVLGWGVELNAPGVFFADLTGPNGTPHAEIFEIYFYSANDSLGYASLVGSAKSAVGVGMDSAGNQTDDNYVINVEDKNTLYIANASVNGSVANPNPHLTFLLVDGATLMLGQDQSGGVTGTVQIGNAFGQEETDGAVGIKCTGACTIEDAPLVGQSSVIIQGQETADILIGGDGTVSLASRPVIGVPPAAQGFNQCPQKSDGDAVSFGAAATVTIKNGTIQCMVGRGFNQQGGTLSLDNTLIQNTDIGISQQGGTAAVTNSTIQFNYIGVLCLGSLDLSGGGNTVVCSSNVESSQGATTPGISVYNESGSGLNASNVAWDTSGADYFLCPDFPDFSSCTCNLSSCTVTAGDDGMDAVQNSSTSTITTTGNTLSTITCN